MRFWIKPKTSFTKIISYAELAELSMARPNSREAMLLYGFYSFLMSQDIWASAESVVTILVFFNSSLVSPPAVCKSNTKSLEYCCNRVPILFFFFYHIFSAFNVTSPRHSIVLQSVPRCFYLGLGMISFGHPNQLMLNSLKGPRKDLKRYLQKHYRGVKASVIFICNIQKKIKSNHQYFQQALLTQQHFFSPNGIPLHNETYQMGKATSHQYYWQYSPIFPLSQLLPVDAILV